MLSMVVVRERPALESKKQSLVSENQDMNARLQACESQILRLLATSEGDILESDSLIDTISQSKQTASEITEKQAQAQITEQEIDAVRQSYIPVAFHAAGLFFQVVELTKVDSMYQYSLQWYQQLFAQAVEKAYQAEDLNERLSCLKDFFTRSLYQSVCRGLFEKDKLLLALALCLKIQRA